jgi:gamma-glutamylcyclotransferase
VCQVWGFTGDGWTAEFLKGVPPSAIYTNSSWCLALGADVNYFAYGSNMDLLRLGERAVHPRERRAAALRDYRLSFNKRSTANTGEGKANIMAQTDETVEGILSEVTEEEMGRLDRAEGVPAHYLRASVLVKLENGTEVEAVTHIANPAMVMDGLKPTKEYFSYLLAGRSFLSRQYVQWLEGTETLD